MKQKFFLLMALLAATIAFTACSSDDNDDNDKKSEEKLTKTDSEVGVWKSGNYFVSLSSDHFMTAYVAPNFIDCGSYTRNNNVITSTNTYYAKTTTYTIRSISEKSMTVDVSYRDLLGKNKTNSLVLTKTSITPTTKDNPLVGKSFSWQGVYGVTTMAFNSYNTGVKSNTWKNYKDYPLPIYYIYFDGCLYYQEFSPAGKQMPSIGGWGTHVDDGVITVIKVSFNNDGSIQGMINVDKDKL